mmetsp:Transcript_15753/g.47799  ORF Transcript_15753/g.47799 Transcript_15753/m.47799 type:complete len:126 (+) Transcript_15753:251-628(+)
MGASGRAFRLGGSSSVAKALITGSLARSLAPLPTRFIETAGVRSFPPLPARSLPALPVPPGRAVLYDVSELQAQASEGSSELSHPPAVGRSKAHAPADKIAPLLRWPERCSGCAGAADGPSDPRL